MLSRKPERAVEPTINIDLPVGLMELVLKLKQCYLHGEELVSLPSNQLPQGPP
jgi:hypothetical protein